MEPEIQNYFTAYLRKALMRQRQRFQARFTQHEYFEQPLLADSDGAAYQPCTNDIIPLVHMILPERERNIVLWHVLQHMSHTEISLCMGISVSAAQKAYQRALLKLRTQLEEYQYAF